MHYFEKMAKEKKKQKNIWPGVAVGGGATAAGIGTGVLLSRANPTKYMKLTPYIHNAEKTLENLRNEIADKHKEVEDFYRELPKEEATLRSRFEERGKGWERMLKEAPHRGHKNAYYRFNDFLINEYEPEEIVKHPNKILGKTKNFLREYIRELEDHAPLFKHANYVSLFKYANAKRSSKNMPLVYGGVGAAGILGGAGVGFLGHRHHAKKLYQLRKKQEYELDRLNAQKNIAEDLKRSAQNLFYENWSNKTKSQIENMGFKVDTAEHKARLEFLKELAAKVEKAKTPLEVHKLFKEMGKKYRI